MRTAAVGVTAPTVTGVYTQSSATQILCHSEQGRRHHFAVILSVCSVFGHCEQFWPYVSKDIGELEEMQGRVSRVINRVGQLPDDDKVNRCGTLQLDGRRLRRDMTEVSKVTKVRDKVKAELLLLTKPCTVGSQGQYQRQERTFQHVYSNSCGYWGYMQK